MFRRMDQCEQAGDFSLNEVAANALPSVGVEAASFPFTAPERPDSSALG